MLETTIAEAEKNLAAVLAHVGQGQEVLITDQGKPVAKIGPPEEPAFNRADARLAAEGLLRLREQATLAGLNVKDLTEEGRD